MLKTSNPLVQSRNQSLIRLALTVFLLAALLQVGPQQLPVVAYKIVLVLLGGCVGHFCWQSLAPYAQASRYLACDWRDGPDVDRPGQADFAVVPGYQRVFCTCVVCQALAVCLGMLAVAWGL